MKQAIFLSTILAVAAGLSASSCNGGNSSVAPESLSLADSIPVEVRQVIEAISQGDSVKFASMVSYPLDRPYPLRNVDDSMSMVKYYSTMVDDSLRSIIASAPDSLWSEVGWRGWTLDDGSYLWIDGKVYDVNYVSKAERKMHHKLADDEIRSLSPELRKGWHPLLCLHSDDSMTLFRVDSRDIKETAGESDTAFAAGRYRLAVYRKCDSLHGRPWRTMKGRMETEGTAGTRTLIFTGRDGSQAVYQIDPSSEIDSDAIVFTSAKGDSTVYPVRRVYWRDFIRKRK